MYIANILCSHDVTRYLSWSYHEMCADIDMSDKKCALDYGWNMLCFLQRWAMRDDELSPSPCFLRYWADFGDSDWLLFVFWHCKILSSCPILKQAKQQARFRIHGSGCPLFSLHLKCLGNERVHTDWWCSKYQCWYAIGQTQWIVIGCLSYCWHYEGWYWGFSIHLSSFSSSLE